MSQERLVGLNKTKTQLIADDLRRALEAGEFPIGESFNIRKISESYGTSITPVREALRILEAEGLIAHTTHRAAAAVDLSGTDAEELYGLRSRIEGFAAERAATRLSTDDDAELLGLHAKFAEAVEQGEFQRARQANHAWHFFIYSQASSELTLKMARLLWSRVEWSSTWSLPDRLDQSLGEHQAINEALLSRTARQSGELMIKHIGNSRAAVADYRGSRG